MGDYGTVLDLETALAGIADIGATGVEILGEGHIPNYPDPSQEWVDDWFRLLDKYGLEPTNYGSWIDTRLHSSGANGRDMTVEEGAAALQRDLRLAKRLGFRFVRPKIGVVSSDLVPHPIWTEVVERSLPLAEELDVIICPEIHSPTPIKHEVVDDYIEFIERTGTKHFGLLIDTGIFQDRPIPLQARRAARPASGVHRRHRASIPPTSLDVAEHVVFIQAKFHDIDENLEDQQIPWEPVLRAHQGRRLHRVPLERVRGRARTVALDRTGPPPALAHAPGRRRALSRGIRHRHEGSDIMPNGLIADDSLRVHPEGLALSLTLPWYRSLWLSSVGTLQVTIDGEPVDAADLAFELAGRALRARRPARAERRALVPAGASAARS